MGFLVFYKALVTVRLSVSFRSESLDDWRLMRLERYISPRMDAFLMIEELRRIRRSSAPSGSDSTSSTTLVAVMGMALADAGPLDETILLDLLAAPPDVDLLLLRRGQQGKSQKD